MTIYIKLIDAFYFALDLDDSLFNVRLAIGLSGRWGGHVTAAFDAETAGGGNDPTSSR